MCGRSSLDKTQKQLEERFNASFYSDDLVHYNPLPNYNVAPTHMHPVITNLDSDNFQLYRWGLIPSWSKDEKMAYKMINARKETLLEKKSFKDAVQHKRCIVPFDGFYEWKKQGKEKIPFRIQTTDQEIFSIAGLWSKWSSPTGKQINSFTLITQEANKLVADIHNRMPAILLKEQENDWLNMEIPAKDAIQMIIPYPPESMHAYPVSRRVGNVRQNDPDLLKEVKLEPIQNKTLFD